MKLINKYIINLYILDRDEILVFATFANFVIVSGGVFRLQFIQIGCSLQ